MSETEHSAETVNREAAPPAAIAPDSSFLAEVQAALGKEITPCYHCRKCAAGCPLADDSDIRPNQIIRLIQFGQRDDVLGSHAIWLCLSCETCTARCPNGVDIAALCDALRRVALVAGATPAEPRVAHFHRAFLATVRKYGRSHEISLIRRFKFKTKSYFEHMGLGMKMFGKGKIKLVGKRIRNRRAFRQMIDRFHAKSQ